MNLSNDPQHDLEMSSWNFDIPGMRSAIERGAQVNNRSGRKIWESVLKRNTSDKATQLECFRFLLESGLTLDGGGKTSRFESLMKRVETLGPAFISAMIEQHGAKAILERIERKAPNDFINIDLWQEAISVQEQGVLRANTQAVSGPLARRRGL